eukprot:TRINITY_DN5742_c0_g1_i1.p1 TRINITY_DN5742_c0_g1~~TRINITY_DN5742_c0_g1_i1.p1  ORF type:complete len:315 (-),score=87.19 TRINITY_DN5742_c0_g1_i1:87-965(-)
MNNRPALRKTIPVKKIQGVGNVVEVNNKEYELITIDGCSVEVKDGSFRALRTSDGTPCVSASQSGKSFYFKLVSPDYFKEQKEKGNKSVHSWYGRHYEQTEEAVRTEVKIPDDLVEYSPKNFLDQRPFLEEISAAEDSKQYDILQEGNHQQLHKLFLGSQDAATNESGLKENNITHILNLATGINYVKFPGITYKTIEIYDLPESKIKDNFQEAFQFMNDAMINNSSGVLVHCNAGVSRSATVVIAYMMKHNGFKTFKEAHDLVKSIKKDINPNPGFRDQLLAYEKELQQQQ